MKHSTLGLALGFCLVCVSAASACSGKVDGPDSGYHVHPTDGGGTSNNAGGQGGVAGASGEFSRTGDCVESQGTCGLFECEVPIAGAEHTDPCVVLSYASNPPTSGTHYDVWADFTVYDAPVPQGFLVHSLEHGSVELHYNCDRATAAGLDCEDLKGAIMDLYDGWAADPICAAGKNRLIVVPDPKLDAPFAAAAWGYFLKGSCFDAELVADFIDRHYGQTYENICNAGIDPANYPADCGE